MLLGLGPLAVLVGVSLSVESPSHSLAPPGVCAKEFSSGITGHPNGITAGPDNRLWFTETKEDRIGVFDPRTGRAEEFPVPKETSPNQITVGPDRNLWFTGIQGSIGKLLPSTGQASIVVSKMIPPGSVPQDIVAGPDGNLYITFQEGGFLGKLNPVTGRFQMLALAGLQPVGRPNGLVADPDKVHLWVALTNDDELARYDVRTGVFDKTVRFSAISGPQRATFGPGGKLFVALQYAASLGIYDPATGNRQEVFAALPPPRTPDLAPGPKLIDVEADPDHRHVWLSTSVVNQLLRYDPGSGRLSRLTCGITGKSATQYMTVGPDGHIWFTELLGGRIARVDE
ncbi:MAG: vgb [Solirubrobacterales bacterium]|nr:vgb [Solirubrobacterales bacterium]